MALTLQTISWISDQRGQFAELLRDMPKGGQISALVIAPSQQRGGHYHTYKMETFILISGKARVELRNGPLASPQTQKQTIFMESAQSIHSLKIPSHVHHTFFNDDSIPAVFVIHCSETFDAHDPDTFPEFPIAPPS